jgi:ribosomal protein S18 acetylase RimI-like enzyme
MVRNLASDIGAGVVPKVTAADLRHWSSGDPAALHLWVADIAGERVGCLVAYPIFSTWRGERGLYVLDLFVDRRWRRHRIGEHLLRRAATEAAAQDLRFLKLEIARHNRSSQNFYAKLGFTPALDDLVLTLDAAGLQRLREFQH